MLHLHNHVNRYHYPLTLLLGVLAVVMLPALLQFAWGWWVPTGMLDAQTVSFSVNLMALVTSSLILHQFQQYPQKNALSYLMPTTFATFAVLIGLVWLLRLPYGVKLIVFGLMGTLVFLGAQYVILRRHLSITLLTIPLGGCHSLADSAGITFIPLLKPVLPRTHFSGIVVDLHSQIGRAHV